ncbi:MAG: hypothetical protein AB8G26_13710 [Ilumatobacter sp.]
MVVVVVVVVVVVLVVAGAGGVVGGGGGAGGVVGAGDGSVVDGTAGWVEVVDAVVVVGTVVGTVSTATTSATVVEVAPSGFGMNDGVGTSDVPTIGTSVVRSDVSVHAVVVISAPNANIVNISREVGRPQRMEPMVTPDQCVEHRAKGCLHGGAGTTAGARPSTAFSGRHGGR